METAQGTKGIKTSDVGRDSNDTIALRKDCMFQRLPWTSSNRQRQFSTAESPVTSFSDQGSQFLQVLLVDFVEAIDSGAIYVDDGNDLLCFPIGPCDDGHDDLALAIPVAGNVTREVFDVPHQLGFVGLCGCSADTFAKADGLAGNLSLERP